MAADPSGISTPRTAKCQIAGQPQPVLIVRQPIRKTDRHSTRIIAELLELRRPLRLRAGHQIHLAFHIVIQKIRKSGIVKRTVLRIRMAEYNTIGNSWSKSVDYAVLHRGVIGGQRENETEIHTDSIDILLIYSFYLYAVYRNRDD